jgi:hypothetical protein
MTAFAVTDFPQNTRACTTVEEYIVYLSMILRDVNPTDKIVMKSGEAGVYTCQSSTGISADGTQYHQVFVSIPIDVSKNALSLPDWKKVDKVSDTAVPASYKG